MRKPKLKIGVLTRGQYQLMTEAVRKPYEDLVAKNGYTMSDLYQMEVTRKLVILWVFPVNNDGEHRTGYELKEFAR